MRTRPDPRTVLIILLFSSACARATSRPLSEDGALLSPSGEAITLRSLSDVVRGFDYVLVGESHDSDCDHRSQAEIIAALEPLQPSVGLEMVSHDKQPVLDRFNRGELSVEEVAEALDWKKSWGFDFGLYAPIFRVAADAGLPLIALNVPREVLKAVRERGIEGIEPEERLQLPEDILLPPEAQMEALREQFEAHREHMKIADDEVEARFERFVLIQSIWDTAMATRALEAARATGRPVVVLAGAGHVIHRWGIASRLETLVPGARILSVLPWRGDAAPTEQEADLFYFCPPN